MSPIIWEYDVKTIKVELKYYSDDPEVDRAIQEAGAMFAKQWRAQAMLVCARGRPEVAMTSKDFFGGNEVIELAEDID